jgi:hypothetical protein
VNAGKAIIFDGVGRLEGDPPDAAVGLVGLDMKLRYVECTEDDEFKFGVAYDMILHPALADRDLGWAVIAADILPIERDRLRLDIARTATDADRAQLNAFFDALDDETAYFTSERRGAYNWKIVDVPMLVRKAGTRLIIERDPRDGDVYPPSLRGSAFIEMQPFFASDFELSDDDEDATPPRVSVSRQFYAAVPALVRTQSDYAKINNFASVLAFLRWARAKGATEISGDIPKSKTVKTPEVVAFLGDDGEEVKVFASPTDKEREDRLIDRCALEEAAPSSRSDKRKPADKPN